MSLNRPSAAIAPPLARAGAYVRFLVLGAALAAVLALTSCTHDTSGPEEGTDVGDISQGSWFAGDDLVGKKVTVSAMISETLPGRAFVFAGGAYGDQSLLVLAAEPTAGLQEGQPIAATGTVRTFDYSEYAERYGLAKAQKYNRFAGEEFLLAERIDLTADTSE